MMPGAVLLRSPEHRWECPNCDATHVTRQTLPHTPFHPCRGLRGLSVPYVPAGTRCKVEAVERGDWIGTEMVQTCGEGRPVMAVVTTRDEGQDCTVYAPTAAASARDL